MQDTAASRHLHQQDSSVSLRTR